MFFLWRAVALVTGSVIERVGISPDRFDVVDHIALLHPGGGLQFTPWRIRFRNGGLLQRLHVLLDVATNGSHKNALARQLRQHALTPITLGPAHNFNLQPVTVTL